MRLKRAATTAVLALSIAPCTHLIAADTVADVVSKSISELSPIATIHLGKTADWVAIVPDAVWVGSTGPFAVHRIDPKTNQLVATIGLPGEPCAGLASGFGSLWVPLCGDHPAMARVDLSSNKLVSVIKLAGVTAEGGVTASADSVWVVVDEAGSLARNSPDTGIVRQIVRVPAVSLRCHRTGPGGDSLGVGHGAIWLTDYHAGTISRIGLEDTLARCKK
jgi:virginiamycin B lyase